MDQSEAWYDVIITEQSISLPLSSEIYSFRLSGFVRNTASSVILEAALLALRRLRLAKKRIWSPREGSRPFRGP